jgi:Alkyl sulfatase dimerisation
MRFTPSGDNAAYTEYADTVPPEDVEKGQRMLQELRQLTDKPIRAIVSRRYLELLGGRDTVLAAAQQAAGAGDHQWAAELLPHVVRVDPQDTQARNAKADALRQVGYTTPTATGATSTSPPPGSWTAHLDQSLRISLYAPDQIAAMPAAALLEGLRVRIDPARSAQAVEALGSRSPTPTRRSAARPAGSERSDRAFPTSSPLANRRAGPSGLSGVTTGKSVSGRSVRARMRVQV